MYAIGNVIYGVPITEAMQKWFDGHADELGVGEWSDLGFEMSYSGNAEIEPGWLGVSLGGIDECEHVRIVPGTDTTGLQMQSLGEQPFDILPSSVQVVDVYEKVKELPEDLKKVCPEVGTYIVWSTS